MGGGCERMKYYAYVSHSPMGLDITRTLSEEQILVEYAPFWFEEMHRKFGKEYVDKHYTKDDCIMDWVVINWAWGVEKDWLKND
jgi:hypothetical protein